MMVMITILILIITNYQNSRYPWLATLARDIIALLTVFHKEMASLSWMFAFFSQFKAAVKTRKFSNCYFSESSLIIYIER